MTAEALGLPLLPPFFGTGNGSSGEFSKGINFAVAGATALDDGFFRDRGLETSFPNTSLRVQLGLFKQLLPSLCGSANGEALFR